MRDLGLGVGTGLSLLIAIGIFAGLEIWPALKRRTDLATQLIGLGIGLGAGIVLTRFRPLLNVPVWIVLEYIQWYVLAAVPLLAVRAWRTAGTAPFVPVIVGTIAGALTHTLLRFVVVVIPPIDPYQFYDFMPAVNSHNLLGAGAILGFWIGIRGTLKSPLGVRGSVGRAEVA